MGVNGTNDHVHLLVWMPPTLSMAETVRVVKSNSSRWVNQERGGTSVFAWQTGYGGFSVSYSNAPAVARYIRAQEEHHKRVSFQEEFGAFLKRNRIQYDERYIWE